MYISYRQLFIIWFGLTDKQVQRESFPPQLLNFNTKLGSLKTIERRRFINCNLGQHESHESLEKTISKDM